MATVRADWPASLPCKIALVGEAPGAEEVRQGRPFVGPAGEELNAMLRSSGILRTECLVTNVFDERPPTTKLKRNDLSAWCWSLKEAKAWLKEEQTGPVAGFKPWFLCPVQPSNYMKPEQMLLPLARLKQELKRAKPNVVIALGGTALWALCCVSGITKFRGTLLESKLVPGLKVLPTFHPAMFLHEQGESKVGKPKYSWRLVSIRDLIKARHEAESPEMKLPKREVWLEPTLDDVADFYALHVANCQCLSVDVETRAGQITCVGLAPSADIALVIPFVTEDGDSYWPTLKDERYVWQVLREVLIAPETPKLFHNGMYDIQLLWRFGIPVANASEDTMLLHHALYPELPKKLEFLGSVYTQERAWKQWRPRGHQEKRE